MGDNREIAPKNVADRVIMGYFDKTEDFLEIAINCLKDNQGIIHYHDKFPVEKVPDIALEKVKDLANNYDKNFKLLKYRIVKSYAPGINHYVFDIKFGEK